MSYRQFPATDANGESRIILEFRPEPDQSTDDPAHAPRYQLDDGTPLERHGREFITRGGELRLSV